MAVVIGAATLIQPSLAVGELALIGKMAADSARKTVESIASESSTNVVKAISKDLADDAKEETAKDVAAAKANDDAEAAKDQANITGTDTKNVPPAPDQAGSKTPKLSDSAGDKTISIEIASQESKTAGGESIDPSIEASPVPPVSLKITIGADGEVKAVSKEADGTSKDLSKPSTKEDSTNLKVVSEDATKPARTLNDNVISNEESVDHTSLDSATKELSTQAIVAASVKKSTTSSVITKEEVSVPELTATVHDDAEGVKRVASMENAVESVKDKTSTDLEQPMAQKESSDTVDHNLEAPTTASVTPVSEQVTIAAVESVARTANTTTLTTTGMPPDSGVVTISRESLDHLHFSKFTSKPSLP